ncbi:hypothetical protein [uncultured Rikenella sp.]|uniref:hypothetical protein n=1 Tax=uncultured Rikenella sp. TaxID=368003 RepID=UPI002639F410|nr:hypothetical protein [uncultured Rikenella sp.]
MAIKTPDGRAPGCRYGINTDASSFVGCSGYSWSSTCDALTAKFVDYTATGLNPGNSHPRTFGFQLRCLSE